MKPQNIAALLLSKLYAAVSANEKRNRICKFFISAFGFSWFLQHYSDTFNWLSFFI